MLEEKFKSKSNNIIDMLVALYIILVFTLDRNDPAVQLINILVVVISVLIITKKIFQREIVFNLPMIALFGFSLFGIASSFWSIDFSISLKKGINILVKTIFLFLLYNNYYDKKNLHFLAKSFILAGIVLCIYQIMDYSLVNYIKMFLSMNNRIYSNILHVNSLGIIISFCFLLAMNYLFEKKLKYIFPILLFFIIILGTCSKTAFILCFVGTMYLFFRKKIHKKIKFNKKTTPLIFAFSLILIIIVCKSSMFNNFIERVINMFNYITGKGYDISTSERITLYSEGFKVFLKHPFLGIGLDTSKIVTSNIISHGTYFHSDLIESLACTGLIGTILFYFPYIYILINNRKKNYTTIPNLICYMSIMISVISCTYSNKYRFFLILIALIGTSYKKIIIPEKIYSFLKKIINFFYDPTILILKLLKIEKINKLIPDEVYLKILYKLKLKRDLNLKNPKTFNEKLQWLKLYDQKTIYTKMVDKYAAKDYIKSIVGEEYIIPTIGIYDSFDDIDFKKMPNKFVIKCTHDSGGIFVCDNKKEFDIKKAKSIINNSLNNNYYYVGREWPYKDVKPRIIIEKFLECDNLIEYKFFCFNGSPEYLYIVKGKAHTTLREGTFYNIDLTEAEISRSDIPTIKEKVKEPKNYKKMIELAKKLSSNADFLRVDFYNIDGKIYCGELTFFPASGYVPFSLVEYDMKLGNMLKLSKK